MNSSPTLRLCPKRSLPPIYLIMRRSTALCPAINPSTRVVSRRRIVLLGLLALTLVSAGCSRKYWREQADDLSYDIIKNKEVDPRWTVPRIDVTADPRSRFFDPFDPDFTPLPPDDPAAHQYMHWVYGMRGYRKWHEFSDLPAVENPDWLIPFGMSEDIIATNYSKPANLPQVERLTLEEAVELAWIHSRDYQTQIENVYLLALALTFQRFRFDLQFVGFGGRPSAEVNLEDVPNTSDSVGVAPTIGVSQLFPSGAQFIAELANNTLWLFSGGKSSDSTASVISYSLVQPLLAGGGRRFVLEGLTQSERNMLYGLRDLARYRMGFFNATVAGGTSAGLVQGVQNAPQPLGALASPTVSGGYLGLLQQTQIISNQRYNIRQLKERLDRLRASANQLPDEIGEDLDRLPDELISPAPVNPVPIPGSIAERERLRTLRPGAIPPQFAGRIRYNGNTSRLYLRGVLTDAEEQLLLGLSNDVEWQKAVSALADRSIMEVETTNQNITQLQTQLANQCNTLRLTVVNLLNAIDQYKLQIGLPPDMPITIDDSMLKPFELLDPRLIRLQDRLNTFVPDSPPVLADHPDIEAIRRVQEIWSRLDPNNLDLRVVGELLVEMDVLRADIQRDGIDVLEADFKRYEEHMKNHPPKPPNDGCLTVYRDLDADYRLKETLLASYHEIVERMGKLRADLAEKLKAEEVTLDKQRELVLGVFDLREDFLKTTQSLSVVQINLRVDLIDLHPFNLEMEDTVRLGLENRMDLMNVRATVMDTRRAVEVTANQLQAVLNIVAAGDIRTQNNFSGNLNPFDFRGDQSSIRAGVQFTAPVQLVQQRNDYRASLIAYQRARRNYMRTEDQVKFDCRTTWRNLNYLRQNFETNREAVRAATAQLDIQIELASAPTAVGQAGAGANQAAQGLNILNALTSVLNAQNNMIQIWVQYESNRLNMYNFMGIMEIDDSGFWVDDFYQRRAQAARAGRTLDELPPELPSDATLLNPPEELNNAPVDASESAPEPQPTSSRLPNVRRNDRLQLVKAESWPERPAPKGEDADDAASDSKKSKRGRAAGDGDPAGTARTGRRGSGRVEHAGQRQEVGSQRSDR